MIDCMINL